MKTLNKPLLTLLSVALISCGWYLEIYYYRFRFVGDGVDPTVSLILGSALTLLLSALFIKSVFNSKKIVIARVVLICMSVSFTMSGQNYSYNESQNMNSVENSSTASIKDKYSDYTVRIQNIENDIQQKNSLLPDNIKERANWATKGVQPLLEEIKLLKDDLKYYEHLRDNLDLSTGSVVKLSAYEALSNDLGLQSPTLFKLVSLGLISLFLALMAPSGIKVLESVYSPKEVVQKPKKQESTSIDSLTLYTNSRFRGEEKPPSLKGRGEVVGETGISYAMFNKISKKAISLGLITTTGNMTIPNVTKSEFEMMLRNNRAYSGKLSAVL